MKRKKGILITPLPAKKISVLLLIVFLVMTASMCSPKKVIIESDFSIVELDDNYYRVSKALWRRMLLKIAKLEKEIEELKLEKLSGQV